MDTQAPSRMQSDNGKEFTAGIVNELCAAFGVKVIHGSIGYPQSQGAVERCNRTIKEKISGQLLLTPTISWSTQVLPPLPANQQAAGANQCQPGANQSCWSPDCMPACCPVPLGVASPAGFSRHNTCMLWCLAVQVRRVQGMINNEPSAALGRKMTRSQALFGEPNQRVLQASAEFIANLMGSDRCATSVG